MRNKRTRPGFDRILKKPVGLSDLQGFCGPRLDAKDLGGARQIPAMPIDGLA